MMFRSLSALARRCRGLVVVGVGLSATAPAYAIVNLEALHFADHGAGFSGSVGFALAGASGNTRTLNVGLDSQLTWNRARSIDLVLLNAQYGRADGETSANKAFLHARHIGRWTARTDWEVFGQIERDEFKRLSFRGLLGGGLRHDLRGRGARKTFLGVGAFRSREDIAPRPGLTDQGVYHTTRANLYLLSHDPVSGNTHLTTALYYQPNLARPADYRALWQTGLRVDMNKTLAVKIGLDVAYDSEPFQSVKSTDVTYTTGIDYRF